MKAFVTDVDILSDPQLLKEITHLQLRCNLDSPRTQQGMKRLGVTRDDCKLRMKHEMHQQAYREHLNVLVNLLRLLVQERRSAIGNTFTAELPLLTKQTSKLPQIRKFDRDMEELFMSELNIQAQAQTPKPVEIPNRIKGIVDRTQKHNQRVKRKLSLVRERERQELEDRFSRSMDFALKFTKKDMWLTQSKQSFVSTLKQKHNQSQKYHKMKKLQILKQEEQHRTQLQFQMEHSNTTNNWKTSKASTDKIAKAQLIEQLTMMEHIQKVGSIADKVVETTAKNQSDLLGRIEKLKTQEHQKQTRANHQKKCLTQVQSQREFDINENLQTRLAQSKDRAQKRVVQMQEAMRISQQQRQTKQQALLNRYAEKLERQSQRILNKHIQIRENLRSKDEKSSTQLKQQIILKDQLSRNMEEVQRKIVNKSSTNIVQLLNNLKYNKIL